MKKYIILKSLLQGGLLAAALALSACAKSDSSSVRVVGRGPYTPGTLYGQNSCANPQMVWGKIFDPSASMQFEYQVKDFVSATLDPQSLGTISGDINDPTGIDFQGSFQFDNQGNLLPSSSAVMIKIVDSYANKNYEGQLIKPYIVEFAHADAGFVDRSSRQFEVRFKDQYGDIVFQGQYDNQIAQGVVTYVNNNSVTGGQPASGTLGSFKVYTCGLIK